MNGGAILSRRAALKGLAGQMALIVAGCSKPRDQIVPYVRMPERMVPGVPLQFATTLELGGYGRGVIATSVEGRPIKIEGNPLHPASLGATDVFAEASVLSLYDPDRSQAVRHSGEISDWKAFLDALQPRLEALAGQGGARLRLLTGPIASPTLKRQIAALRQRFPALTWHVHNCLQDAAARQGGVIAFGRPVFALPRLGDAEVAVCLDADPLGPGPLQIANGRGFAQRRMARRGGGTSGRLYAVESTPTLTGANADHKLVRAPAEIAAVAIALARKLGADLAAPELDGEASTFCDALARDLLAHKTRALVMAGPTLAPDIHALCHWINAQLRAPFDYFDAGDAAAPTASLDALIRDCQAGQVDSLIVLACNPAYDAPPGLGFGAAIAKAKFRAHLGTYFDETAALCDWHIPQSHVLEDWSDLLAPNGAPSLAQPLIAPLYDTRSAHEVIAALAGSLATARDLVRETWKPKAPAADFEAWWRRALQDGVIADAAPKPLSDLSPASPHVSAAASEPLILVTRPDPRLYDGSFANNAWLQELPQPLTKEVWGNSIGVAPADAARLGVVDGDVLRLAANGGSLAAPIRIDAGHAPGILSLALGHGRTAAGGVGNGVGANAYGLRSVDGAWRIDRVAAQRTGERRPLPATQKQFALDAEAADLFLTYDHAEFSRLDAAARKPAPASFLADRTQAGARWGMVIDTSLCIGCNACVVACQVENNSPVVGPDEVAQGRDMHWLRIDVYQVGEGGTRTGFQPVPCMHCETAPCEPVCPTAASVHDSEGLNVQVYNRCIGTRFCEANCPYKVRRFNFFGYADGQQYGDLGAEIMRAHDNPDVTVRSRGVMEKCTYCIQRISRARRAADREDRPIREGEVVTACQAACPTRAINFGDLSQEEAQVAVLAKEPHRYSLLAHLNTRPRTTYLAQVRNLNPDLGRKDG